MMNLSAILSKVWANIPLSPEESNFLSQHISSVEGKEVFERELFCLWDGMEANDSFDADAILGEIRRQIDPGLKEGKVRGGVFSTVSRILSYVAAAIVLIVGSFYWFWSIDDVSEDKIINASRNKVELITADGQKIILDDSQLLPDGFKRVKSGIDDEQLVYSDDNSVDDEVVNLITLKVPRGETYTMQLPDGTKVYLNAMTTLRFPEKFTADSREVYLNGEAAFAVVANKKSPFYVRTDSRTVQVTGTKFNVSAYDDDKLWRTLLFEGKVNVIGGKQSVVMIPNQEYELNKASGSSSLKPFAQGDEIFAPWASGIIDFKSVALTDIVRQLQRWYDFTVTYVDESLKSKRFTGAVRKDEPLNSFLSIIEQTTDIEITLKGNHITVDKRAPK